MVLNHLPDELVLRIFGFLEYDKLLILAQTSKHFNKIASDNVLWKELFELHLDLLPFVQNTTLVINKYSPRRNLSSNWKDFYHESYFKQRNKYIQYNNTNNQNNKLKNTENTHNNTPPNHNNDNNNANATTPVLFTSLRTQRTRILFIGPKHAGKATLFYHLKFGTCFKGIYYLRKYGTVVSIDLNLSTTTTKPRKHPLSLNSEDGFPPLSDVLPADLEVWDTEDFDSSPFKRTTPPEGVIMVVDSTGMERSTIGSVLNSLHSSPHIGPVVPVLVLATHWDSEVATHAAGVARALGLWSHPGRPWRVQSCCATSLLGVKEGLQWLHSEIREKKSWES